jgi:hypothetical protein
VLAIDYYLLRIFLNLRAAFLQIQTNPAKKIIDVCVRELIILKN